MFKIYARKPSTGRACLSENFLQLYQEITSVKGDEDGMVVAYL